MYLIPLVFLAWLLWLAPALADDPVAQQRAALEEIRATATAICGVPIEPSGSENQYSISGEMGAQLTGLIRKLFKIGGHVSGELTNSQYQGLLRQDVPRSSRQPQTVDEKCLTHLLE